MRRVWVLAALAAISSCNGGTKPDPDRGALRQPSGLALSPDGRFLFVTGGNWDRLESGGTLATLDVEAVHAALRGSVTRAGGSLSASSPCRRVASSDDTIECDPARFIDADDTLLLGDGIGNIAIDQPTGDTGPYRLLIPQRAPAALVWADVTPGGDGVAVDCGQDEFGVCDEQHVVRRSAEDNSTLSSDPSRVFVDDQGFRFAYVPHLLGGDLTLIDLDGDQGPEITGRAEEFYREDVFDEFDASGGFAVAARACDPAQPSGPSRDCVRPQLYTTHRYWPGLKKFTVAAGLKVVVSGRDVRLAGIGTENVVARPIMGDLAFEDPEVGDSLLLVQTTPGSLARVDTSIDPEAESEVDELRETVALCSNPNVMAVHRPANEEWLALVSCLSDGRLAVVGLSTFTVIASVPVGAGANELAVDPVREQVYVANSRENTISIVSLDRQSPDFLSEWARIGLGAGSREG